jgi:hypothetical protein
MMKITLVGNNGTSYGTAEVPDGTEEVMWKGKIFVFQFEYGGPGPFVEQAPILTIPDDGVTP